MKTILEDGKIKLETSDWRYSAAILGLIRYFECNNIFDYEINDDYIIYNKKDITKENYMNYILEKYKNDNFAYTVLYDKLNKDEYTDDEVKEINKYIKSCPSAIKKLKLEFNGTNKDELLDILEKNKESLVLDIFKNRKKNGYVKFCNPSCFFKEDSTMCRMSGYYVDPNLKMNLLEWNTEKETFQSDDIEEFDFIPFAFSTDYISLFINNNFSIKALQSANSHFNEKSSIISLYKYITNITDTEVENNVQIIIKEKDYFETLYLQKNIIEKLQKIKKIENISKLENLKIKIRDDMYIDMNYILKLIFNNQNLDSVIHIILKNKDFYKQYNYYLNFLIKINMILYKKGKIEMIEQYKSAYACAKSISEKLDENKLNSYRQKLTSALISNNKDNIYNILLQLSNYSHVNISFIFDVLDNYELNKNQIYAFISALTKQNKEKNEVENND